MASRQEEKEARRQARLEQEAAEAKSAARNKRLQLVLGGVLVALIIVGVVVGISASGGGSDSKGGANQPVDPSGKTDVKLPAQQTANANEASAAAGCTTKNFPSEGREHENKTFTAADYKTNPPTSGNHFPTPAQDGIYQNGPPPLGESVHALEHGRIEYQYKPGTSKADIDKLVALVNENQGYHILLFPNQTNMDAAVAATAWTWSITCPTINDKTWDALRTFRDTHIDKAPERIP
jgi:Protein of unknown function (DUF3105)